MAFSLITPVSDVLRRDFPINSSLSTDPTAANNKLIVTFTLNEPGTTYCRVTRTSSGETSADMPINRILTADWSSIVTPGSPNYS